MRIAPTDGRRTLGLPRREAPGVGEGDQGMGLFGPLVLVAELAHEGRELHHLVASNLAPLLLRRVDGPRDEHELRLGGWRRRQVDARMALDDPCLPRIYELGLREGQVFELSDYVFGVDLRAVVDAGLRLPWSIATELFRELLVTLGKLRAAGCLPHRLLRPRNLRFSLEHGTAALRICCNAPLPATHPEASAARKPRDEQEPPHGAQLRALIRLLSSVSSPADETQRALLLDESRDAPDVLADHVQIADLPLDPLSVAKIQCGSATSRGWLEKSAARGQHKLLVAQPGDRQALERFWQGVFELAREDRARFDHALFPTVATATPR